MMSRVHGASAATIALLTLATVSFAQDPTPVVIPPADSVAATPAPAPVVVDTARAGPARPVKKRNLPDRRASLGGSFGFSWFVADKDYSHSRTSDGFGDADVSQRLAFQAVFRYQMSDSWRWQVSPGYTWTGYKEDSPIPFTDPNFPQDQTKENMLTLVLPFTGQIQYTQDRGRWRHHLGGGGGAYRVWVENQRKVLQDPISTKRHSGFYPGLCAEFGTEYFLTSLTGVSLEWSAAGHWIFAQRDEQFPSGFNSFLGYVDLRFGAAYHFNPMRVGAKKPAEPAKP